MYNSKKIVDEDFARLRAAKTKEELNQLLAGRVLFVNDKSDWHDEMCTFIEMTGEGKKENWKAKMKTSFGTELELPLSKVIIAVQVIHTRKSEVDNIINEIKKEFKK